jgi:4-amino-4-deoxy-L-arabinose transferase-like glycosyltransferase
MMRFAMRRLAPGVFAALMALGLGLRIGVVINRRIDPDESQHLHVAWLLTQGQVPYRDFWEHHLPFFYYAMAPLTAWLSDRPAVYFAARAVMVALAAVAVLLTWRLARRLSGDGAVWAVVVLLFLPQFAETSTETRPDVPSLVAHLASLLALVRWRDTGGPRWLWVAGAWQGAALALSVKAVFALVGVGAIVLGWPPSGRERWGDRIGSLARLLGGGAVVLGGLLAAFTVLGGVGTLHGLYRDVVQGSLGFVDLVKTWPVFGSELGVFLVGALGLGLVLRVRGLAILSHPVHGVLLVPALTSVVALALPRTPAVYQHAWLPILPVVAIYAGLTVATLAEWARRDPSRWRKGLALTAIAAAVVVPAGETMVFAVRDQNSADLRLMQRELRLACPGEAVLDGTALYVFRPAAYRYGALVRGVREWVARGVIPEEVIAGDMRAARAPIAHVDFRIKGMVGPVADLLRRHYVRGPDGLLVAGTEVPAGTGGGRVVADLLAPGPYLLDYSRGLEVSIDGTPARQGWLPLAPGPHEITWLGPGGTIRLTVATCPERRFLERRGAVGEPRSLTASGRGD